MYQTYINHYKLNQILSINLNNINGDINSLIQSNCDSIINNIINNNIDIIDEFIIKNSTINPLLSLLAIVIYNTNQNKSLNQLIQLMEKNSNISITYIIHAIIYIIDIKKFYNNYKLYNYSNIIQNVNTDIILKTMQNVNQYCNIYIYNCFYFDRLIDYIYEIENFLIKNNIINSNISNLLFELKQKIIINYLKCNIYGTNIISDDYNQKFFNDLKLIWKNFYNKKIFNIHINYFTRFFKEKSTYNDYIIHTFNKF